MYRGAGVLGAGGGLFGVVRRGSGTPTPANCGLPTSGRLKAMAARPGEGATAANKLFAAQSEHAACFRPHVSTLSKHKTTQQG